MLKPTETLTVDRLEALGGIVAELQFGDEHANPADVARAVVRELATSLAQFRDLALLEAELAMLGRGARHLVLV
ncbi:hypothetical protein ACFVAJ_16555 [Agromyces sp. NPDC057679]|uniref:hypothetical protein n=1 Tax=Agromyces sp. NPDC057679 TaxID=3346207 RepID=UPI00366B2842